CAMHLSTILFVSIRCAWSGKLDSDELGAIHRNYAVNRQKDAMACMLCSPPSPGKVYLSARQWMDEIHLYISRRSGSGKLPADRVSHYRPTLAPIQPPELPPPGTSACSQQHGRRVCR